jgi:hypothetical protein
MNIPHEGDTFIFSSGAGLGNSKWGWAGRRITIIFNNPTSCVVYNSSGAAGDIYLHNSVNWTANQRATLSLISDGTYWYETGRSTR